MMQFSMRVVESDGKIVGKAFGARLLISVILNLNLNENYKKYSWKFLIKLVNFNLNVMSLKIEFWNSLAIKVNTQLQFFMKNCED